MFKNRIAYWAKEKGIRYNFLAKKAGVSPQTFSKWVKNETQPNLKQSYVLARILDIPLDDLCEEEEK